VELLRDSYDRDQFKQPLDFKVWSGGASSLIHSASWATRSAGRPRLRGDRCIPGTRANNDHIAITTAGIWVIDAKKYNGRAELRIEGGILRPRVEKVLVGRRDCTKLVGGVLKQIDLVPEVVATVTI
jgi:hypothetical protein